MTTFKDGPAHGTTLLLRRTPVLLRIVIDNEGKVDALDQISDQPADDEICHLYVLREERGRVHLNAGKASGCYGFSTYQYQSQQPDQETLRDQAKWQEWAKEHDPRKLSQRKK